MTPTIADRIQKITRIVARNYDKGNDAATYACDLLADLMHYCDANGVDLRDVTERAQMHFEAERIEEQDDDAGTCAECGDAFGVGPYTSESLSAPGICVWCATNGGDDE